MLRSVLHAGLGDFPLNFAAPDMTSVGGQGDAPIWHIVLFKFRDDVTVEMRAEVAKRFDALKSSERDDKPYILDIVHGAQNSEEGAHKDYELGFIVKFDNEDDRAYYVGRPFVGDGPFDRAHDEFKTFVGPLLAETNGVLVFDFTEGNI